MTSRSIDNSIFTLTAALPVIVPAGGPQYYEIDASSNSVTVKLPAPVAGSTAVFVAYDVSNAVTVQATSAGPIGASTTESIALENAGDAIALIADSANKWTYLNIGTTNLS